MENKFLPLESALNMVLNINMGIEVRLNELNKIEEYANGLIYLPEEKKQLLSAVLVAFRNELYKEETGEECIGGYNKILKEILNINQSLRGPKCLVYGNNWLAEEIKNKMRGKSYSVFDWKAVNPAYINEYDLYILCDELLKVYDLQAIEDKDKILKMWDFLKYKFVVFPAFYDTYMGFRKQHNTKIKCIVTGNTNIRHAVCSKLLHTKTISLANTAQDIFYDFQMFCHAYESMKDIKYAVVGLAPYSLRYDTSKSKVEWRRCLVYYPIVKTMHNCDDAQHLSAIFESEDKKIKRFFDEEYMESLYELFEGNTRNEPQEMLSVYDENRCSKETIALNQREISELYNRPFKDIMLENKVILEEYARFCKGKGIQVIFFIPPYTQWYKDHMQTSYYEELMSYIQELCAKYDAKLVDMMQTVLPDCYFADYANVNRIGAVKAASQINEIIDA